MKVDAKGPVSHDSLEVKRDDRCFRHGRCGRDQLPEPVVLIWVVCDEDPWDLVLFEVQAAFVLEAVR